VHREEGWEVSGSFVGSGVSFDELIRLPVFELAKSKRNSLSHTDRSYLESKNLWYWNCQESRLQKTKYFLYLL